MVYSKALMVWVLVGTSSGSVRRNRKAEGNGENINGSKEKMKVTTILSQGVEEVRVLL